MRPAAHSVSRELREMRATVARITAEQGRALHSMRATTARVSATLAPRFSLQIRADGAWIERTPRTVYASQAEAENEGRAGWDEWRVRWRVVERCAHHPDAPPCVTFDLDGPGCEACGSAVQP